VCRAILSALYAGTGKLKAAVAALPLERTPFRKRREFEMLSIVSGAAITGAGVAGFWYLRPRNGQVHPLAAKPVLEWVLPTLLVGTLAFGVALIISGSV
jgi:hypothetical protein